MNHGQRNDLEDWIERLRAYSKKKRELMDKGIDITPELHKELIEEFEV